MKKALKLFTIAALLVMLMVSCQPAPEEIISPDETEDDAPAEGIGSYGPAGGRVFYDCDADNTEEDPDGEDNLKSDVCGWRYLEAAPSLIYKGAEVASTPTVYKTVPEGADVFKALYGYYLVGETKTAVGTSANLGTGKANSAAIYEKVCNNGAIKTNVGSDSKEHYIAAYLCETLTYTAKDGTVYDDWFLPSSAELKQYYLNISVAGYDTSIIPASSDVATSFMTSTEKSGSAETKLSSWCVKGSKETSATAQKDKNILLPVLAIRSFL